jgi:hypothetical protein
MHRLEVGEIGRLLEIANRRRRVPEHLAGLCLDHAGGDLQQRRLAGAVAADKADLVAGLHLQAAPFSSGAPPKLRKISSSFRMGGANSQTPERS